MHYSAYVTGLQFRKTYVPEDHALKIAEIGSQIVGGQQSLREIYKGYDYTGIDFQKGEGVDVVLSDPYEYPFEDNTFDFVLTSSCFEHSELFWLSFLESLRILKPNGLLYCNAPGAWMQYHRFPVDCWRFWPDAAKALQTWAQRNRLNTTVLETYSCAQGHDEEVSDWVAVFIKDAQYIHEYPKRMLDSLEPWRHYFNGFRFPGNETFSGSWSEPHTMFHQAWPPKREVIDGNLHVKYY